MQVNDVLFGRVNTPYQGVSAKVNSMTSRFIQLTFDHVVCIEGSLFGGQVLTKSTVQKFFESSATHQLCMFHQDGEDHTINP